MIITDVLFPIALHRTLSYRLSPTQATLAKPGLFVRAPIGNRTFLGVITAICQGEQEVKNEGLKFITSVETHLIPISHKRLELWKWMSAYYLCSLGEVMRASISIAPPVVPSPTPHTPTPSLPTSIAPILPALASEHLPALSLVQSYMEEQSVVLLRASRQRTIFYIHLLRQTLLLGKNALLLIPELGAGEQRYRQIQELFGHRVFLFHSRLTPAKRRNTLQEIAQQTAPFIVIGSRSSLLFVDFKALGLIIVDEEQDYSYKQTDPAPRFHARDVALFMGRLYQTPVILGTSCASLESEYNVYTGKYHSVTLSSPLSAAKKIEVLDTLKLTKKKQMHGVISDPLLQTLTYYLCRKEQVLLFTRRGNLLQEELQPLLPNARIAYLDESASLQKLYKQVQQFKNREIDILIGIHTLHKNLDFGEVGLVAILHADQQLSRHDFRAHERVYQIFTALSASASHLILQTDQPAHPLYDSLQNNKLQEFVREQLEERKNFHYPPFVRLVAVRFKHRTPEAALSAAQNFAYTLPEIGITSFSGPFTPYHDPAAKYNSQILWIPLERHPKSETIKQALYQKALHCAFPGGVVQIDVDAY